MAIMNTNLGGINLLDVSDNTDVPPLSQIAPQNDFYIIIAKTSYPVAFEKVSIDVLSHYIANNSSFSEALLAEVLARQTLHSELDTEIVARKQLAEQVDTDTNNIQDLLRRVTALENANPGGQPHATAGNIAYGIITRTATLPSPGAPYPGTPATVELSFPAPTESTDTWYFTLPSGIEAIHLYDRSVFGGHTDRLESWNYHEDTRTWTFTNLTPGYPLAFGVHIVASEDDNE